MDSENVSVTRALKITVELVLKQVSWVGVRLEPSNRLQIRVCLFGFHVHTRLLPTCFPVRVQERLIFERTFPLCTQPLHVFSNLDSDYFALDLVETSGDDAETLATFRSEVNELLFGDPPHMHVDQSRTKYYDLNLENTSQYSKYLCPVLSATVKVAMTSIQDPVKQAKSDSAFNLTLGNSGISQHPVATYENAPSRKSRISTHLTRQEVPRRLCQRVVMKTIPKKEESPMKRPFVVRHVDEKLIGRTPGSGEGETVLTEKAGDIGYLQARKIHGERSSCTSQRDTVSSRLRRRPKIQRSITELASDAVRPRDHFWCREQSARPSTVDIGMWKKLQHSLPASRRWSASSGAGTTQFGTSRPTLPDNEKWSASGDSFKKPTDEQDSRRPSVSGSDFTTAGTLNCACCFRHHNQTCTICKLYQQYFGEAYPNHSL